MRFTCFIVFIILFIITITENGAPLNVFLSEDISAFGMVRMSLGITPELRITVKIPFLLSEE